MVMKMKSFLAALLLFPLAAQAQQITPGPAAFSIMMGASISTAQHYLNCQLGQVTATNGCVFTRGGTVRNLYVSTGSAAPGAGQSVVVALSTGSTFGGSVTADTALTCTVSGTNNTCTDLVDSVVVTPGTMWLINTTPTGSSAATRALIGMDFYPN